MVDGLSVTFTFSTSLKTITHFTYVPLLTGIHGGRRRVCARGGGIVVSPGFVRAYVRTRGAQREMYPLNPYRFANPAETLRGLEAMGLHDLGFC